MDLINIKYSNESGEYPIRTISNDGVIYFSLKDMIKTLSNDNVNLGEESKDASIPSLLRTVTSSFEDDEYIYRPSENKRFDGDNELFITQPGVFRLLSYDNSKSSKKFQRWLFHEVIPSLTKFGTYPPPRNQGSMLAQMAELLAQNTRALADNIAKQELLEQDVMEVKDAVTTIDDRLNVLEENTTKKLRLFTASDYLSKIKLDASHSQKSEVASWCENLLLNEFTGFERNRRSNTDVSINEYPEIVLEKAVEMMRQTGRI
ncbi:BRO-like protein [Alteromonas sp. 345S023]|uniref:BRO-like protein n=1 Tax=Alteromonas profundi TaxID=2696062 RepID=A0A7X5LPC6_9ALTE|nr:BRO family protein [Alteromonas profundi]NDV93082.1 BRO-like protein [Alteromonas profundi]